MATLLPVEEQERLARALREGSSRAFEHLYTQLRGPIYNLAARIVGDQHDAADITQEVFLDAYRQLPEHKGELRLEPWLYRIAVNTCYDHLRRRTRRPTDSLADVTEIPAPGDEISRSCLVSAVSQALSGLSPRYRTALVLKDIHGLGNGEIASILGIKSGAAAVLLFRARNAFKQAFRELAPVDAERAGVIGVSILPTLALPSLLDVPPAFAAAFSLAGSVPAAVEVAAGPATAAAAAIGGALAKIGAILTTKTAVAGWAVAALAGGGIAVQTAAHHEAPAGPRSAPPSHVAATPMAVAERQQLFAEMAELRRCAMASTTTGLRTASGEPAHRRADTAAHNGTNGAGDGRQTWSGDATGSSRGAGPGTTTTAQCCMGESQTAESGEQSGAGAAQHNGPGASRQGSPGSDPTSSGRD